MRNFHITVISISLVIFFYSVHFLFNNEIVDFLTKEDGFYEWAGALLFLAAGLLFFKNYLVLNKNRPVSEPNKISNIFYLFLGVILFFGFLEEISWGQRIFNIPTPDELKGINMKNEINVHNLEIFHRSDKHGLKHGLRLLLNADRIFSIFWFSFCCVFPLLIVISNKIKLFFSKINLPIPPLAISFAFILNYAMSKVLLAHLDTTLRSIIEIKEFNFALLFFMISIWFYSIRNTLLKISVSKRMM